jgi:hypothetical protein
MIKRKIRLGALLTVSVLMLALLIGGLYGTFDDTETSIGNTFTAGSLNLVSVIGGAPGVAGDNFTMNEGLGVDNADGINDNVTFGEVYPGATGYITWTLSNTGSIDGTLTMPATSSGRENGQNEPEALVDASAGDPGELVDQLSCVVTIDGAASASMAFANVGAYLTAYSGSLAAGDSIVVRLDWTAAGAGFDNTVQTDTAQLDISFYLAQ